MPARRISRQTLSRIVVMMVQAGEPMTVSAYVRSICRAGVNSSFKSAQTRFYGPQVRSVIQEAIKDGVLVLRNGLLMSLSHAEDLDDPPSQSEIDEPLRRIASRVKKRAPSKPKKKKAKAKPQKSVWDIIKSKSALGK